MTSIGGYKTLLMRRGFVDCAVFVVCFLETKGCSEAASAVMDAVTSHLEFLGVAEGPESQVDDLQLRWARGLDLGLLKGQER